ncbi:MAG: hypothetical protein HY833_01710 [Candidatus Aenigmarchaeota archaeon]|nr:hypothetical protein [Candidatus Aenigmarchaeota archaeon]
MPEEDGSASEQESHVMSSEDVPRPKEERRAEPQHHPSASDIENKVKLSLSHTEKKIVDLEIGLAEFKDTMSKFSGMSQESISDIAQLPDIKQRVEDLEDLVMVETAGIEELKDLMEDIRNGMGPQKPESQMAPEKIALIDELERKMSSLDEVKRGLDDLSHEIASMKQGAMQAGSPSMPQDTQLLSARIENVKTVLEELIKRKVEVDMKIEKLDKTMSFMQTRSPEQMSQEMKRDFEALNRNFSVVNSRMDAIEGVSKSLSDDMQKVRSLMQRFDTFDKASGLAKDLQARMEEFKFIENEVKRVSSRVEGFYENLDQRLDKIREFERVFPQLRQEFDRMRDEIMKRMDENKISVLDRATKDETSALRDRMSQLESKLSGTQFRDMEAAVDRMKQDLRQAVKEAHEPLNVINIEISDMLSRIVGMETRLGNIERMFQSGRSRPVIIE